MEEQGLLDRIRHLAAEGRGYNARIAAARGPERHALRLGKAEVGRRARPALLAYAMLRGVPYRALEATCREDHVPGARARLAESVSSVSGEPPETVEGWMGSCPGSAKPAAWAGPGVIGRACRWIRIWLEGARS